MRRAERALVRMLAAAAVGFGISLTGCTSVQGSGTATVDREAAYAAVSRALEEIGYSTYTLAPNSTTPYIGSQGEGGFGLTFSYPIEGGPLNLSVSSGCFPLEEWPDEEG